MGKIKQWILSKIQEFLDKRKYAAEIDPAAFRDLARELRELSLVAERLWPQQHRYYVKIKQIQSEMDQLDKLAAKPEFRTLSAQRRLQLRKSLISSRDQLLETVQSAPSPTARLQ